jgi:signal peptidase I
MIRVLQQYTQYIPNLFHFVLQVDKLTPRIYGIQGGSTVEERTKLARLLQEEHDQKFDQGVWYEPRVPVDKLPAQGAWSRLFKRLFTGVSVGDVVVVKHIYREGTICKRVLGLPGDTINNPPVEVRRSLAWKSRCQGNTLLVIPDGHMWLEGDNSKSSVDSKNYGPVPTNLLVGRVVARIWPLRGRSIMERGAQPATVNRGNPATTVFPAGYQGQEIVKEVSHLAGAR